MTKWSKNVNKRQYKKYLKKEKTIYFKNGTYIKFFIVKNSQLKSTSTEHCFVPTIDTFQEKSPRLFLRKPSLK